MSPVQYPALPERYRVLFSCNYVCHKLYQALMFGSASLSEESQGTRLETNHPCYITIIYTSKATTAGGMDETAGAWLSLTGTDPVVATVEGLESRADSQDSSFLSKAETSCPTVLSSCSNSSYLKKKYCTTMERITNHKPMLFTSTYSSLCFSLKATIDASISSKVCFSFSTTAP